MTTPKKSHQKRICLFVTYPKSNFLRKQLCEIRFANSNQRKKFLLTNCGISCKYICLRDRGYSLLDLLHRHGQGKTHMTASQGTKTASRCTQNACLFQ